MIVRHKQPTMLGGVDVGSPLVKGALLNSAWDGVLTTCMLALAETFGVAAAVALGVPPLSIALLGSLPLFLGALAQAFSSGRVDPARGRKHYVVRSVRLQALFLLGCGLAGWVPQPYAAAAFVVAFVLYGVSGALFQNLWMTWFSDLVPSQVMGRHTAWRSALFSTTQLTVSLAAGLLTRQYTAGTAPWAMFLAVFATAGILRGASSWFLERQYEPPLSCTARIPSFWGFRPDRTLLTFSLAIALLQGGAILAGPFFSVWFLRDLHFSYLTFAVGSCCTLVGNLITLPLAGKLADRAGTGRMLRISGFFAALVPLPYMLFEHPGAIWAANFYSGVCWTVVNLTAFKYLLAIARRHNVPQHSLAFANLVLGLCVLPFSLLGGWLATRLPTWFDWQLQSLFFLSFIARAIVVIFLFPRIEDIEEAEERRVTGFKGFFYQVFRWKGPGTSQA